jgi:hypothetical protein
MKVPRSMLRQMRRLLAVTVAEVVEAEKVERVMAIERRSLTPLQTSELVPAILLSCATLQWLIFSSLSLVPSEPMRSLLRL